MAGFLGVSVVLAELATATNNSQPAVTQKLETNPTVVAHQSEAAPADQQQTAAVAEADPRPNSLTYGADEVIKMYRGGVKADVLLTYIETSSYPYQLSSKEILYLNKIGVPSVVVTAMIRRDHQLQLAKVEAAQQNESVPAMTSEPASVAYSQPAVVVVQQPVAHVSKAVCSAANCPAPNSNVTVIGSRYGSTFNNGCYYGPFSCSPARAYFNAEFGPLCRPSFYDYNGFRGGFGFGHRWGRF